MAHVYCVFLSYRLKILSVTAVPIERFCRVLINFFLSKNVYLSYVSFGSSNLSGSTVISYFNSSQVRTDFILHF
jgi:hypothetical protein